MEFLKSNIIIDPNYIPSINGSSYLDYFNRALSFAQTNYSDQIRNAINIQFTSLSPAIFFKEYIANTVLRDYQTCAEHSKNLCDDFLTLTTKEVEAYPGLTSEFIYSVNRAKYIINSGIKLFGWKCYRNFFLDSVDKLKVLPLIEDYNSKMIGKNIGIFDVLELNRLDKLANHFNFENTKVLCLEIRKHIVTLPKVIELVLWYATHTFNPNLISLSKE